MAEVKKELTLQELRLHQMKLSQFLKLAELLHDIEAQFILAGTNEIKFSWVDNQGSQRIEAITKTILKSYRKIRNNQYLELCELGLKNKADPILEQYMTPCDLEMRKKLSREKINFLEKAELIVQRPTHPVIIKK